MSRLWLILALFLALHVLYNWAIPLGEGPDEPGHLAYVLFLAEQGRLPVQRVPPALSDVPGEGHQPPLAYALAVPTVGWLPVDQRTIQLTANPQFVWAGGDQAGAFMRGSRELWPWQDLTLAWHLVRAGSGLWGLLAIILTYLAARHLAPTQPELALLAAALVAFNPQLLFTTALVTNDALLLALAAACLWWCLRPTSSPWIWAMGAGLLFGLVLLTKQSGLLLGPLLLWGGWRVAGGQRTRFVAISVLWGGLAILLAGWWFARNVWLYGDLFGLEIFSAKFATEPFRWTDLAAWHGALGQLFGSFWAYFGWISLPAPGWVFAIYGLLSGAALLGWGRAALRQAPTGNPQDWRGPLLVVVMALIWTLAFAATAGLVAWQGRMLFPGLAGFALLLAGGLLALAQGRNHQTLSLRIIIGGLLILALWVPLAVIRPAYPWVALPAQQAQASLGKPTYARYAASWEAGVELRGWHLEQPLRAGTPVQLRLTWHSLEHVPRPWTVFVHLVDANDQIVAESNRQPRDGTLPFPLWTPGDWIHDPHTLEVPADLSAGTYRFIVGLYLPAAGGERQATWAADGSFLGNQHSLGWVEVVAPSSTAMAPRCPPCHPERSEGSSARISADSSLRLRLRSE
ncbi:MAG: glycosyltransferase family 39 protein [Oscillochloridaceae bacterium umkhey_bin13]